MIFCILLGVAALFVGFSAIALRKVPVVPIIVSIILIACYTFCSLMVMRMTTAAPLPGGYKVVNVQMLAALNTSQNVSGSFFLGSGYVNEELMYSYLTKTDDGMIRPEQTPAYTVSITETSDVDPQVVTLKYVYDPLLLPWVMETKGIEHIFYVPEGTVIQSYNVNP